MKLRLYILHTHATETDFEKFNDIQKEGILLSSDEITGYKFLTKGDVPRGQLIIKGNIINSLTEEDSLKADFAKLMERLLSNSLELDNVWKKIPSKYLDQVKNMIKTKYTNIDTSTTVLNDNITYLNQENLQKLKYWNQEFYNSVYRTVILEIIYGDCTRLIVLEKAFIHTYKENCSKFTSNGEFELVINQFKWIDNEILNYISDKEVLGVPVDIFEGATPQTYKGEFKGSNFSLNGLETPLIASSTFPTTQNTYSHNINTDFISNLEGGHVLKGYVPNPSSSKSGVTVSVGFDLGARKKSDILGFNENLQEKLSPYLGLKKYEAVNKLKEIPLEITQQESEEIYSKVKKSINSNLIKKYNASSSIKFHELPVSAQTVIASVEYQYGSAQAKAPTFWKHVTNQNWGNAVNELENFGDAYPTRRKKEALYLKELL